MNQPPTPRRGFLGRMSASVLGLMAAPSMVGATRRVEAADEAWLRRLEGKHRQFFDVPAVREGRPLARVFNFLDAYREAYGTTDADTNVVFGAHGTGLAFVLGDALWARYRLGQRNTVADPLTGAPATRNPYVRREPAYDWPADYSVTRLQARGVRFIACLRSIRALSRELAAETGATADAVRDELIAGLLPGVIAVPAMVVAINRAHEERLSYVFAG